MFFDFYSFTFPHDTKIEERSTQEQLDDLRMNFNALVGSLQMLMTHLQQLNELNSRDPNTDYDVHDLMQWANYVSKVSHKLLAPNEYPTWSYMIEPIKDEFGNVQDQSPYSSMSQPGVSNPNVLLYIDRNGNIYLDGVVENNPTVICNRLKELAQIYLDGRPINNITDLNL